MWASQHDPSLVALEVAGSADTSGAPMRIKRVNAPGEAATPAGGHGWLEPPLRPAVSSRAPFEPFRIDVDRDLNTMRVALVGELDIATVVLVEAELQRHRAAGVRSFVLDLHQLTFMDSIGMRLLLNWGETPGKNGIDVALIEGPPQVQRMFALWGVHDRLSFRAP